MSLLFLCFAALFGASIAKGLWGVTLLTALSGGLLYLFDRKWQRLNPNAGQTAGSKANEPTPPDSPA